MSKIGLRAGLVNVLTATLKELGITSEANQFKVHKSGELVATSTNQIFTIEHGLGYTPAVLSFKKGSANAYYGLNQAGGENWVDKNTLSIQLDSIGDKATYLIFKDFGS